MKKIAINGFGRIGRLVLRKLLKYSELQVVAVNDITNSLTLAHLFKYDSNYGPFNGTVTSNHTSITINNKEGIANLI